MANLDVQQMNEAFMLQQMQAGMYDDRQAMITGNRASYGDIPAMLMSGAQSAGGAMLGVAQGAGSALSAVGSMLRPIQYTPPAQMYTGYYGQYQMQTGPMRELAIMGGMAAIPRGINAYQYGYGAASNLGERTMGLAAGAATVGTGLAAGSAAGAFGGLAGGAIGAFLGGPIGAGIGSAVGGIAGNIAGYMGVDALADQIAQRREVSSFLETSSFRYVGAGSNMADPRMGGGMNSAARTGVVDMMKKMDIRDSSMGMGDLYQVMQGATNLGLFAGTQDMDDFKKKFKDIVEGVKSVTKTLNTSLQEGLQVMKDFKAIGIDASQMSFIGTQASALGKVAGRTGQEMVGLGLQGAELFRGTGVEMKVGYEANIMNMAAIRSARDAGIISQEAVAQAGGEEAMAQRLTAGGLQFMQSGLGRGFMTSFYGKGGFDVDAFKRNALQGGASITDLAYQGANNMGDPRAMVDFTVNQDKTAAAMGKAFGGRGAEVGQLSAALGAARLTMEGLGVKDTEENRYKYMKYSLMMDQGLSSQDADTRINMMKNAPKDFEDRLKAIQSTRVQQTVDEAYRTSGLHYRYDQAMDKIDAVILNPVMGEANRLWEGGREKFINYWERDIKGIVRSDFTDTGYERFVGKKRPDIVEKPKRGPINLDVGGGLWNLTMGEELLGAITDLGGGSLIKSNQKVGAGDIILDERSKSVDESGKISGGKRSISKAAAEKFLQDRRALLDISESKALEMAEKDPSITDATAGVTSVAERLQEKYGDKVTVDMIAKEQFGGRGIGELTPEEVAGLRIAAKTSPALAGALTRDTRSTGILRERLAGTTVMDKAAMETEIKGIGSRLAKKMGLTSYFGLSKNELSKSTLQNLNAAREAYASGDSSAAKNYLSKAALEHSQKYGTSYAQAESKFKGYMEGGYQEEAKAYDATGAGIFDAQVQEGGEFLLEVSKQGVAASGTIVDKKEVTSYLEKIFTGTDTSRAAALKSLDPSSKLGQAIASIPEGANILRHKEAIGILEKYEKLAVEKGVDKSTFAKDIEKDLTAVITNPQRRSQIVDAAVKNKGMDQAIEATSQSLNLEGAGKTYATAPGSGGGIEASGTYQGSAAEIAAQQVNINYEILEALKALNAARYR